MFQGGVAQAAMEIFSFAFMLFLGVKFLMAKSVPVMDRIEHNIEQRIEKKLHPHSAFMTGFVRTLANPGIPLGWIILSANFISRGWVVPNLDGKIFFLTGVATGVAVWLFGLAWAISLGHKKFTEKSLLRMERGSGVLLIALGLAHGVYIAYKLARHMDKIQ